MSQKPDATLISGEVIIRKMRPHWNTLIGPVFVGALLLCAYLPLMTTISTWPDIPRNVVAWILSILVGLLALRFTLKGIVAWATTVYLFTNKRIITSSGLIRISGESIALNKIQSIQFTKTLFERLFGSGKLIIESASENHIVIHNVTHAEEVYRDVYEQISTIEQTNDTPAV